MAHEDNRAKRFREAKKALQSGVKGNKKAVIDAYKRFADLRETDPHNPVLEAYYGSTLALMGRDAAHPLEKADKAQQGLDILDRAVSMDPNHSEIRMIRATVGLRLPESYFHRSKTAIEDFSFLLANHQSNPRLLSDKQVIQALHGLGTAYQNAGKPKAAKEVWKRLAELDPQYKHLAK